MQNSLKYTVSWQVICVSIFMTFKIDNIIKIVSSHYTIFHDY
jgi:hypothetical protein